MFDHLIFSLSVSVQDLFYAPAAEEEIEALLHRLHEIVGKVSTQQVLASSKTHGHVPQVLSYSGGGHGLGKRTLRMHGSVGEHKQKQQGQSLVRLRLGLCSS